MRKSDFKKLRVDEGLADLADIAERDHEVQMARAELYKIAKYAIKLHEMLKGVSEETGLEGWIQSKITKSADYIGSVYHHLDYETKFGDEMEQAVESSDYKNNLKSRLEEKAKSKAQQRIMGMAYAYKKGELKGKASEAVKTIARTMSLNDLKDYASTEHKGKPEHVKEGFLDDIKAKIMKGAEDYEKDMKVLRSIAGDSYEAKTAEFSCNNDPRICLVDFIKKEGLDPKDGTIEDIESRL